MLQPFKLLNSTVQAVLNELEEQDRKERDDEVDRSVRLRQIPRETGEFLYQFLSVYIKAFSSDFIGLEIGTSGGYSAIWHGLALKTIGRGRLISIDIDHKKHVFAKKNIQKALVEDYVETILGDARKYIENCPYDKFQYVFLDAEKEDYVEYYNLLKKRGCLSKGSVLIADNVISHKEELKDFIHLISEDSDVSSIIVSIGSGLAIIWWL
ncbi:MAG: O-methyltransferase [Candidatus Hodarchaeota archaeon]